jgi:hypothetical protein
MRGGGIILGDWTHRRGDVGGARAVSAEIARARPKIAWTFAPPHAGNVDQVRIAGELVYVATMEPGDPSAVGWEHATIYAIEAATGRVAAVRALPDPVPVAAMVVDGATLHVLATRHGEPVFWYALDAFDLRPRHRRALALDRAGHWDVLEAWCSADGGIWMEIEAAPGGKRTYAFAIQERVALVQAANQANSDDVAAPRDACCVGQTLYAPCSGAWDETGNAGTPPAIWQLDPQAPEAESGEAGEPRGDVAPWARAELTGPHSHAHALAAGGAVSAIAVAHDPSKERRALVQAIVVDRVSGVVRSQSPVERLPTRGASGESARLARRPNGDMIFQCVTAEREPASDIWRVTPSGELIALPLPRDNMLLDAALGDALLMHAETRGGGAIVGAVDIDRERLLGKRASTLWSIETPDLGGSTTVYAGAGHVVARGAHAVAAIRV